MCRACVSSVITDKLMSGVWPIAPNRRQFMAYAVSAGAAVTAMAAGREARAASSAAAIFGMARSIR
jgi:hypothetical protein